MMLIVRMTLSLMNNLCSGCSIPRDVCSSSHVELIQLELNKKEDHNVEKRPNRFEKRVKTRNVMSNIIIVISLFLNFSASQ